MHRFNLFAVVAAFTLIAAGILPWTAIAVSESQSPSSIEQIFQNAKKDYLEKNMDLAAEQIQKSASYMKAQAVKASDKGKEALNASVKELEKLADDVKKGTVPPVKRMEETFARAYVALASDSQIKSTESWAKKEKAKAGDALDSANKYLERSFPGPDKKLKQRRKKLWKSPKNFR
jgi:hypothetical protein